MDYLYPELEDYIYQYCEKFMTEEELMAGKTIMYRSSANSKQMLALMREKKWISEDPDILRMIGDGHEALKRRIVNRIWSEHRNELNLNLCPECKKIARTPDARQCRFCFHDWR